MGGRYQRTGPGFLLRDDRSYGRTRCDGELDAYGSRELQFVAGGGRAGEVNPSVIPARPSKDESTLTGLGEETVLRTRHEAGRLHTPLCFF